MKHYAKLSVTPGITYYRVTSNNYFLKVIQLLVHIKVMYQSKKKTTQQNNNN